MKNEPGQVNAGGHAALPPRPHWAFPRFRLSPSAFRLPHRYRWRLRWGRPMPWPTRVEIIATLVLWLAGAWGWERWGNGPTPASPAADGGSAARSVAAAARTALLLTTERPDADGLFAYGQDRLAVRVPVALRQAPRQGERPDLTKARGQEADGMRFELTRVFDPRSRHADAADLAHDQAAAICRAAGAALLDATDELVTVPGAEPGAAIHTVVHARLPSGNGLTVEGLTLEDPAGPVAWMLWAGYPSGEHRAAALVRASFASAALRPLSNSPGKGEGK